MLRKRICFIIILLILTGCPGKNGQDENSLDCAKRLFIDMAGRKRYIPEKIKKIYCPSPMGTTLVYTFDPELLLGWNYPINKAETIYMPGKYKSLPVIGGWFGKTASANMELLIKAKPDLIISIVEKNVTQKDMDQAERLEKQTGTPVVMAVWNRLNEMPALYTFLGTITGNKDRAVLLSSYSQRIINRTENIIKKIPLKKRVHVYYAEGLKGLNTEPGNSFHVELIKFCGGINVAKMPENKNDGYGHTPVTIEQVICWNPQFIIISDFLGADGGVNGWRKIITDNPAWSAVKAIQKKQLFVIPHSPFHWTDRPPSVNRLAGVIWLPTVFYPEKCSYDLSKEIRDFYKLFYNYNLNDAELGKLVKTRVFVKGTGL